jgi:excisionase family DNA binding protein
VADHRITPGLLDDLGDHPDRAAKLPPEMRVRVVLKCLAILAGATVANEHAEAEKPEPSELQTLLTVEQAAERANVPTSWIRQAVKDGRLPSVKLGHYRRIHPSDLQAFLTTHAR